MGKITEEGKKAYVNGMAKDFGLDSIEALAKKLGFDNPDLMAKDSNFDNIYDYFTKKGYAHRYLGVRRKLLSKTVENRLT
ncbi:MAG: hypothetical protein AABW51_03305 [Nanoarchaeota archaeon]